MQQDQVEQIKKLVRSTELLKEEERAEWLSLFGVMNDKQLLELRKILEGVEKKVETQSVGLGYLPKIEENPVAQMAIKPKFSEEPKSLSETVQKKPEPAPVALPKPTVLPPLEAKLPELLKKSAEDIKKPVISPKSPNLSHILNIPAKDPGVKKLIANNLGQKSNLEIKSAPKIASKVLSDESFKGRQNGFFTSLKSLLGKKELKAGHPEAVQEKELPAPHTALEKMPQNLPAPLVSKALAPAVLPKTETQKTGDKTAEAKPLPPTVPKPPVKLPEKKPEAKVPDKPAVKSVELPKIQPIASTFGKGLTYNPAVKKTGGLEDQKILQKVPLASPQPQPPVKKTIRPDAGKIFAAGVQLPNMPEGLNLSDFVRKQAQFSEKKPENIATAPEQMKRANMPADVQSLESKTAPIMMVLKYPDFKPPAINVASDLLSLKLKDFPENHPAFSNQIKALVKNIGIHEVMAQLEQSPLYKAYLKTGTDALSQKYNFSENSESETDYMNLDQFEGFADLLMQVQAE